MTRGKGRGERETLILNRLGAKMARFRRWMGHIGGNMGVINTPFPGHTVPGTDMYAQSGPAHPLQTFMQINSTSALTFHGAAFRALGIVDALIPDLGTGKPGRFRIQGSP